MPSNTVYQEKILGDASLILDSSPHYQGKVKTF
jgi:hypothetical protein